MTDEVPATGDVERLQRLAGHKRWLVDTGNEIGRLAGDQKEWKSQIGLLAEAAARETEPRVLLNLLRYQQARNKGWHEAADPLFEAMKQCIGDAGDDDLFAVLLIRHLFLYASRAYIYRRFLAEADRKERAS